MIAPFTLLKIATENKPIPNNETLFYAQILQVNWDKLSDY